MGMGRFLGAGTGGNAEGAVADFLAAVRGVAVVLVLAGALGLLSVLAAADVALAACLAGVVLAGVALGLAGLLAAAVFTSTVS